ncbi:STAS domain-containing protein [Streptomyces sp. NRRL S-1521]|uniref:STAS domain-containing protein n=1 Tax=Streptomyces sp. NRRL S-1521 TaxID=1609100 RepID=UPI0007472A42|nr:STAS domain-containing protein [Streptomyces sp. NRRL S-1521]KUL61816.1 anti-anti-sigma factor [Streptomyces sp. NRRL S-1521]
MNSSEPEARLSVATALREQGEKVADRWVQLQLERAVLGSGISEAELREEADAFVSALRAALETDRPVESLATSCPELRQAVTELSLRRARGGASPTATSLAVLALKEALLEAVREQAGDTPALYHSAVCANRLLDTAGALSFATYVEGREEIIRRQSRQLLEVSTPVVRLWDKVLAVPLIGTLDTTRTQVVMENLLQSIERHEAEVAIIDITGVPTVDTAVAHHLMQTVNAVRLMGADCVISGIRPPIAQIIAQLGIDLSAILTRATLADALAAAIRLTDRATPPADPMSVR